MRYDPLFYWSTVVYLSLFIGSIIAALMVIMPIYNVWASHKSGQADLARAQNEQNIQIAEARARNEAAQLNKSAAIIEAQAVAEQIRTIGERLQQHDLYLRWQWIKMMEERDGTTIYVPTEANLPVLEATRNVQHFQQAAE